MHLKPNTGRKSRIWTTGPVLVILKTFCLSSKRLLEFCLKMTYFKMTITVFQSQSFVHLVDKSCEVSLTKSFYTKVTLVTENQQKMHCREHLAFCSFRSWNMLLHNIATIKRTLVFLPQNVASLCWQTSWLAHELILTALRWFGISSPPPLNPPLCLCSGLLPFICIEGEKKREDLKRSQTLWIFPRHLCDLPSALEPGRFKVVSRSWGHHS